MDVWTFARRGKLDGTPLLASNDYAWFSKHASQDRPHRMLMSDFQAQMLVNGGNYLTGTATLDPGSITAGATLYVGTVTVTGAVAGDIVLGVSHSDVATTNGDKISFIGKVSAADTVAVSACNGHSGAVDLASGTARVVVLKKSALGL